jgi:hypothetical protein
MQFLYGNPSRFPRKIAFLGEQSNMSDKNKPSPGELTSLIQRLIADRIMVVGRFESADSSVKVKVTGLLVGCVFAGREMMIATEIMENPACLFKVVGFADLEQWAYVDDSQIPPEHTFGSTLRIPFSNGSELLLSELRN